MITLIVLMSFYYYSTESDNPSMQQTEHILLPPPALTGFIPLEHTIQSRRSTRQFADEPLGMQELSQLLWAGQGITDTLRNLRSAPSAGATYPIDLYVAAGNVDGLEPGLYRYVPEGHGLRKVRSGDPRRELSEAALRQPSVLQAPVSIIITGIPGRTSVRYGSRAERYVFMEAGHVSQNIYLQSAALGLGTVVVGAFSDDMVAGVVSLANGGLPLYIMPVGKPRSTE